MTELELVAVDSPKGHLILAGSDGEEHRLPIDEALRAAVRRARPQVATPPPPETGRPTAVAASLRPREIQWRLRAGETAEEIAQESGLSVEKVRRYESPVVAERDWVVAEGRRTPLSREPGAPTLGEIVVDRLARRGVDVEDLFWTAVRRPEQAWQLVLEFRAGERDRQALWSVDLPGRAVRPLDDESRWLTEAELAPAHAVSGAQRSSSRVFDVLAPDGGVALAPVSGPEPEATDGGEPELGMSPAVVAAAPEEADDRTEHILEGLAATRGVRQELPRIDEADDALWEQPAEPPDQRSVGSVGAASVRPLRARAAASDPAQAQDQTGSQDQALATQTEPSLLPILPEAPAAARPKNRSRRTSVPSWDEIVFGAKPE